MRRVRRRGANKEKVFGCDLLEHLNASSQEIPQVLRCCSEFVETHGIVDGIYRLSGVSSNIQKLRGEFENDGSPDLNKDVYLQDIHCVSSLCKAYFRELPNPLLTYQLYENFAEAVAIQLEEERLVKIRDVLKELPRPHYRTLEFLMRHLVRMASFSPETNMHARNLAIVWAPNLLRSKDIEASGFNGRAAFMEVRVQSIVVEFILTHVPQLFPEPGVSSERRNSLPSPSAASSQEEGLFKPASPHHIPNFGNISPGDGPLPIRPYHAIIEGTDKRKGSLKGRKWMSIFNIGGRFHDPRRRHKHSAKEKDRPVLRPARSMDSLSNPPYENEGSRLKSQRTPSIKTSTTSPLVAPTPQPGSDVTGPTGAIGASEYAVTYRRGTGLVSTGTQGTYTALDPEGLGVSDSLQSRSPGVSTKAGRRAAMHITGPTMVTVPLHITSNLALGVLQGGGSDRVILRGRDKDGGDRVEGKEGGEKAERRESRAIERKAKDGRKVEEEEKIYRGKETEREEVAGAEVNTGPGGDGEEEGEGKKEEEKEEVREECGRKQQEEAMSGRSVSREQRAKSLISNAEEGNDEDAIGHEKDTDENNEYIDMKGVNLAQCSDEHVFDASDILNSTEVEGDDLGLSGYVQDNFEFLDQMDCSVMDHMDCSAPYQVMEFSVEPPGHSDDEYIVMEQAQPSYHPAELQVNLQPGPEACTQSPTELNPHRKLSTDANNRHTKSLSLPHMTSPIPGPDECFSEDEAAEDDSDDNEYSSEEDESMFVKSLPSGFFLNNFSGFDPDDETQDSCVLDGVPVHQLQISDQSEQQLPNLEFPVCKESTPADEERIDVKDEEEDDEPEEKELTKMQEEEEDHQDGDQLQNNRRSKVTEEDCRVEEHPQSDKAEPFASEASTHCSADCQLPSNDESSTLPDMTKEVADNSHSDYPPCHSCFAPNETADTSLEEFNDCVGEEDASKRDSEDGEDEGAHKEIEDRCQETDLEVKEDDENMWGETVEGGDEMITDIKQEEKVQEDGKEQDIAICRTSSKIWAEFEDVVCEVIEEAESKQAETQGARESVAGEGDASEAGEGEEEIADALGEDVVEADGGGTNETEVRIESEEDSAEETLTDTQMAKELEKRESNLPKTKDLDEAMEGKLITDGKEEHHNTEEVVSKEKENNDKARAEEQQRKQSSVDLFRPDVKELKERKREPSDSIQGGVGRKLVISKHPKVYQAKAVPVVPPKPQHCKITALTLRQQQQQRETRDADRGRESPAKAPAERHKACAGDLRGQDEDDGDEGRGRTDRPTLRGGEKERERRRDGDEGLARDASRHSPLSMCFDEAVAIATMRREKVKGCEKERQRERGNEVQ